MAQRGQHVHNIDGKVLTFDNETCVYCHPERLQQPAPAQPSVYRKGNTVVVKVSKARMITDTYWGDKNVILHTISQMARDTAGKVLVDSDKNPIWNKMTVRLNMTMAQQYVMELSKLIQSVQQKLDIPQRA